MNYIRLRFSSDKVASCSVIDILHVQLIIKMASAFSIDCPYIWGYEALIEPSDVSKPFKEISGAAFCSLQLVKRENWSQQFPTDCELGQHRCWIRYVRRWLDITKFCKMLSSINRIVCTLSISSRISSYGRMSQFKKKLGRSPFLCRLFATV